MAIAFERLRKIFSKINFMKSISRDPTYSIDYISHNHQFDRMINVNILSFLTKIKYSTLLYTYCFISKLSSEDIFKY